jgi:exopolysaccharide biosynthesis polyprenyl glycosylphosphotransferase
MYLGRRVWGRAWAGPQHQDNGEIDVHRVASASAVQGTSRDVGATRVSIPTADPRGNGPARLVETSSGELPRITLQQRQSRNIWAQLRRDATRLGVLLLSDVLLFVALRVVAGGVRSGWFGEFMAAAAGRLFPWGFLGGERFLAALLVSLAIMGSYGQGDKRRDGSRLLNGTALAALITLFPAFWEQSMFFTLLQGVAVIGVVAAGLIATRLLVDHMVRRARSRVGIARALVIAHTEADWQDLADLLRKVRDFVVVERVILEEHTGKGMHPRLRRLGTLIHASRAETVLVWGDLKHEEFALTVDVALASGCRLLAGDRTSIGEVEPRGVWMGGRPLVELTPPSLRGWQLALKRGMDLIGATVGLLVASPLLLAIAIAIVVESGRPVFFRQWRIGRAGRAFRIFKFRSMVVDAERHLDDLREKSLYQDGRLFKLVDDPRVTRVGRLLRRTSLDELPQLINVLKGEMSLVGPRPPVPAEVEAYDEHDFRRFDVKPGITGPWQAGGRNGITDFKEVVRLESEYVRRWSIVEDLRILLRTIPVVFHGRGAH